MSEVISGKETANAPGDRQWRPGAGLIVMLLVLLPILAGLSALALSAKQAPEYEAKASVLVTFGREYIFRPLRGDAESWSPWRAEIAVNAEMGILNSPAMQDAAIRSVGADRLTGTGRDETRDTSSSLFDQLLASLHELAVGWDIIENPGDQMAAARAMLARKLNIKGVADSAVIHVSFRHSDPVVATDVLDALLAAYFDSHRTVFSSPENRFLQTQLEKRSIAFQAAGQRIIAFQDELGIADFNVTLDGLNQRDVILSGEIDRLAGEIAAANVTQEALRAAASKKRRAAVNAQADAVLGGLEAQFALVQSQHRAVSSKQRLLVSQKAVYDALQQQRDAAEQAYLKVLTQVSDVQTDTDLDAAGLASVKVIQDPVVPAKAASLPPLTLAGLAAGLMFMAGLALVVTLSATRAAATQREPVRHIHAEPMRAPTLAAGATVKLLPVKRRSNFGLSETDKVQKRWAA